MNCNVILKNKLAIITKLTHNTKVCDGRVVSVPAYKPKCLMCKCKGNVLKIGSLDSLSSHFSLLNSHFYICTTLSYLKILEPGIEPGSSTLKLNMLTTTLPSHLIFQ